MVTLLLANGADVNQRNTKGTTALYEACRKSISLVITKKLLDAGANWATTYKDDLMLTQLAEPESVNRRRIKQSTYRNCIAAVRRAAKKAAENEFIFRNIFRQLLSV